MNIRVRDLTGVRAALGTPSPEDLAAISALAGREVSAEEVYVRTMRLAHNQYDTTGERFPKAYLDRFSETLPGLGVLVGHDYRTVPVGRFFAARTTARQEQGFPTLCRDGQGRVTSMAMEPQDLRVMWTEPAFYARAGSEMQQDMDLGILRDVSIGFRYDDLTCDLCKHSYFEDCPHVMGYAWNTEGGQIATGTFAGDPKGACALEGSLVWKGAQQQARLVKAAREGTLDPAALAATPFGEDLVLLKEAEAHARRGGHQVKSWAFPGLKVPDARSGAREQRPSGNADAPCEGCLSMNCAGCTVFESILSAEQDPRPVGQRTPPVGGKSNPAPVGAEPTGEPMTEEEKAAFDAAKAAAETAQTALAAEKTRAETAEAALEPAKALAGVAEKALADLRTQILDDDLRLTGKAENAELSDLIGMHVAARNYDRLRQIAAEKAAAVIAKFPAGIPPAANAGGKSDEPPAANEFEDVLRQVRA